MEIRVASLLTSFGATGAGSAGHPAISLVPVASPDVSAGYPAHSTSSGFAGVRSSGCPESRLHSAPSAVFKFQVSPQLYFAPCASRCMAGFPVLCIFRPCRRSIIELPRLSYPSVPPMRQLRVSPLPRSFGCASRRRFQVYPSPCIFRLYRQRIFELPRISRSSVPPVLELSVSLELRSSRLLLPTCASGCPWRFVFRLGLGFELPGCPGFSLPRRRLMDPRVSPVLAPSGSAVPASSGFPESCIYGWVDDVSRSSRTLHPRLTPRMNLRIQAGYAVSVP
jgi:hypothetical protein